MTRLIEEQFLDKICCYRALRAKNDSHAECEYYCSLPPRDYGNEPICEYQCTKETDNEDIPEIRWTDKLSIDFEGNIRDFNGRILFSVPNYKSIVEEELADWMEVDND